MYKNYTWVSNIWIHENVSEPTHYSFTSQTHVATHMLIKSGLEKWDRTNAVKVRGVFVSRWPFLHSASHHRRGRTFFFSCWIRTRGLVRLIIIARLRSWRHCEINLCIYVINRRLNWLVFHITHWNDVLRRWSLGPCLSVYFRSWNPKKATELIDEPPTCP